MQSRVLLLAPSHVDLERETTLRTLTRLDGITAATIAPTATSSAWWRALRTMRRQTYDVVHAWGEGALLAASLAHTGPIVFSFADVPDRRAIRVLRAVAAVRQLHVVCPTTTSHRLCLSRGMANDRCYVIRPGVPMNAVAKRNVDRRRQLGIGDDDRVLLLANESTRHAGHREIAWAAAILNVVKPQYRLLVMGRGDRIESLIAFCQSQRQLDRLIIGDRVLGSNATLSDLLPLADAAVFAPTGPTPTLPIAACMAAGLPIVSTLPAAAAEVAELLEDRHTALIAAASTPRAIAMRIADVWADDRRRATIADRARAEAFDYFTRAKMMEAYDGLYAQVAKNDFASPAIAAS